MAVQERTEGGKVVKSLKKDSWLWSIQPLLNCTKWLGVDLLDVNQMKNCPWFVFHRLFCLLLTIGNQVICLRYVFGNAKQLSGNYISENGFNSDAFTWNAAIDFLNYSVHSIGCHLVLLIVVRARWSCLVKSFQILEPFFGRSSLVAFRNASVSAIVYCIVVHAVMCCNTAWYHKDEELPYAITFVAWLTIISQFYPIAALVLFVIVSYASSTGYRLIQTQLEQLRQQRRDEQYNSRLLNLKKYHALVCETIENANYCFGWIFVFSIPFHFVVIITTSFFTFGRETEQITIMETTLIVVHAFHLSVVCYAADMVCDQANSVSRELAQMQIEPQDHIKSLASAFMAQADQFSPQISALGLFHVSKKIIPQVVSTTLTYFFIIYQFQSTEKEFTSN